jgi:Leucine-rich repeat (LRR) protein
MNCTCAVYSDGSTAVECVEIAISDITSVAPAISSTTTVLNFNYNLITELPARLFASARPSALANLAISFNLITRIDPDAFVALAALEELTLTHNSLTELATSVLAPLVRLRSLFIDDNFFKTIPLLPTLPRLTYLMLGSNPFERLSRAAIANVSASLLNFAASDLRDPFSTVQALAIDADFFAGCTNLLTIQFSGNKFTAEQLADVFSPVGATLRSLTLSKNNLTQVPASALRLLKSNGITSLCVRLCLYCRTLLLRNLHHFYLNRNVKKNRITELPAELANCRLMNRMCVRHALLGALFVL